MYFPLIQNSRFVILNALFFTGAFLSVQSTVLVDLLSVDKIAKSQALLGIFIGLSALVVTPFAGVLTFCNSRSYVIPKTIWNQNLAPLPVPGSWDSMWGFTGSIPE